VVRAGYFRANVYLGCIRCKQFNVKALSDPPVREADGDTTIYQVAERAAVSIATVSRVMRGSAPVAAKTRARVEDAMAALRFTPSRLGVSLAERHHGANGIVFPDLSGPYFAEVVLGYEEVAAEVGRGVLILSTHGRQAAREMVLDLAARVDGMVVLGRTVDDDVIAEVLARNVPVVVVARDRVRGADSVNAENEHSAEALAAHLAAHGHRSFAFLGDAEISPDAFHRWSGLVRALRAHGVAVPERPVPCPFDEDGGREAASVLLRADPPDALVCANDEIALGAITAAERLGMRVPDDLAVTGWDDVMAARHSRPGLTTVRQPMRQLGAWAARRLHDRLGGDTSAPRHEVLRTQLVVRASCGHHNKEDR
jgi:LacI family transcriptional regulator